MDFASAASLPALLFALAEARPEAPLLWNRRDGTWRPRGRREVAGGVRRRAAGLVRLGLKPGDRVLLVSENRPEWFIADFAVMTAGGTTVPAYTTSTLDDYRHLLADCQPSVVILSGPALARPLLDAVAQAERRPLVVSFAPLDTEAWHGGHAWHELDGDESALPKAPGRDDLACLIYTSGTGGQPKGVMLTHGNILADCAACQGLFRRHAGEGEVFLSFLPLSHSYEHTVGQVFAMGVGAQIYYAESIERLMANMAEVRPTLVTAVPRLFEVMVQRLRQGMAAQPAWRRRLFAAAERYGRKRHGPGLAWYEVPPDALLDRLVRDKVRARFGGRLKAMVSGGAALDVEAGRTLQALGLTVLQGYGQTEASPVVSVNPPDRVRMETVGPPLPGVTLRIAEDGEILLTGATVMRGYWRQPEETARGIRDGWLHTGDVGSLDPDGYLRITDRKKDLIVLSGGDKVAPAKLEALLVQQPEVAQAMVMGGGGAHVVALLVPDETWATAWSRVRGIAAAPADLARDEGFRADLGKAVSRVNAGLSVTERIRRFAVAPEPFSRENGLLTPTLKVRRHEVRRHFAALLDGL